MKFLQAVGFVCLCAGPLFADNFLVLPFFNNSGSNNLDWVGESIGQTIREALASEGVLTLDREAREEGFRRLSVKPYAVLTKATVMRLAESLDADQVVFGSFSVTEPQGQDRTKGMVRIQAQAIDIRKARRTPEYTESGALDDLARLQSHLAWQIMGFVLGDRRPTEQRFQQRLPMVRVDALESYVRGTLSTAADQKLKYFSQAVRLEPNYSRANFEMGRFQFQRKAYRLAADSLQKVPSTDGRYREATFFLGLSRYYLGEFAEAEQAFEIVAQQVPLNEVLNNLGAAQSRLNRSGSSAGELQESTGRRLSRSGIPLQRGLCFTPARRHGRGGRTVPRCSRSQSRRCGGDNDAGAMPAKDSDPSRPRKVKASNG